MNDLIEIESINKANFNYEQLDSDTSAELQDIANNISVITENAKYLIGEQLCKAQELLSKKGYGCFNEWIESYKLKKRTAYNYISYYKVFVQQLHKQEELKRLSDGKIYALGRLDSEQQSNVLENVNLENMTNKEVDKLTKQLKEEQEYSEELQEAIKQKENQIRTLQNEIENIQIPKKEIVEKEVVREVIPENLILEKQSLEKELETLRKRAEKAENTVSRLKLDKEISQDKVYTKVKLDNLLVNIKDFLDNASKYTYLKDELQKIPTKNRKILESKIQEIDNWVILMKQALNNEQGVVGNIIFGEGEIINE